MGKNIYNTKAKMTRAGQNPDILELAEIVDEIRNRLVELHNSVQAFDNQINFYMGKSQISMTADGVIQIDADEIRLYAKDEVDVKTAGKIRMKGSKILNN